MTLQFCLVCLFAFSLPRPSAWQVLWRSHNWLRLLLYRDVGISALSCAKALRLTVELMALEECTLVSGNSSYLQLCFDEITET